MSISRIFSSLLYVAIAFSFSCNNESAGKDKAGNKTGDTTIAPVEKPWVLDTADYLKKQKNIANGDTTGRWPVANQPLPLKGAIFPFHRVIAYYGNLFSVKMGILGELPKDSMFKKLKFEVNKWQKADSSLKVIPALHYIATTAQGAPGRDGKYRMRMPHAQIDTIIKWAKEIDALVFIDVQVGHSTLEAELPLFEKFLSLPNVHLGIDPEFSMKGGERPGSVIGSFDAPDINYTKDYLASLVKKYNIPPKVLVIHRFTQAMVKNYKNVSLVPEVQIVMDMDGWGEGPRKVNTYRQFVFPEPIQFTGFKIFYKNDTKKVNKPLEMQPEDVLKLRPKPLYIQYQ